MPLGIPHSRFLSWPEADQDKAIAFVRDQKLVCQGCGTREAEWKADRFAFVAQHAVCLGCEVLAMERDNVDEAAKGVQYFLLPRALAEAAMAAGGP